MEQLSSSEVVKLESWADKAVLSFVINMRHKLRMNHHKGHWKGYEFGALFMLLLDEVEELKVAMSCDMHDVNTYLAIIDECADVANFAMMISDNAKRVLENTYGQKVDGRDATDTFNGTKRKYFPEEKGNH